MVPVPISVRIRLQHVRSKLIRIGIQGVDDQNFFLILQLKQIIFFVKIAIRILLFSSVADKIQQKISFFLKFFAYYL